MSPKTMHLLAKPMLFAAAIIWGTSFFIMKNALDALPPFYLLAIRFTAGAVLLALAASGKMVALDCVEYNPARDSDGSCCRTVLGILEPVLLALAAKP